MKITAIIAAGGTGSRAGFNKNKLFIELNGIPVIVRTVSAFSACDKIDDIIITANKNDVAKMRELFKNYINVRIVIGGKTRTESVMRGLLQCKNCDFVLIHDGARPFVSQKILQDCIDTVIKHNSAVCAVPSIDTVSLCENGKIISTPPRETVYSIQTPQAFLYDEILTAYGKITDETFTDDASVYAKFIAPPHIFTGDTSNKKLTFKEDFITERVGVGIDTHAFGKEQNHITLGGVKIPSDSGLIAHSDGDVLVHAIMDALLSAAALPDIGHYFPDTDDTYKDADSILLLKHVCSVLAEKNYKTSNVSAAIQAQKPKLMKYIPKMREIIADALNVSPDDIGISAGTNEGLGYVGEGKGITVTAYAKIRKLL